MVKNLKVGDLRGLCLIVLLILGVTKLFGQGWLTEENNMDTNWNISMQVGPTLLLGEMKRDFSGFDNNMSSQPDIAMNLQLSKMVWERVDVGIETSLMRFNGINNNPYTINYLRISEKFNSDNAHFLAYPVSYNTDMYNLMFFTKYNFINLSTYRYSFIKMNLYLRVGLGLAYSITQMGYKEEINYILSGLSNPFFSSQDDLNFTERLHVNIATAFGLHYQLSERVFLSGEMGFHVFGTPLIDGVYNVNDQLPSDQYDPIPKEYLTPVFSLAGKFMVGCTYFFNFDSHRKDREHFYPWYINRYRSYFSKYHTPASKRVLKERLPFYNNKLDE